MSSKDTKGKDTKGKNSLELQRVHKQLNYQFQQTHQRYNQAVARRKVLRKDIDALRMELDIYQSVGRNINRSISMEEKENKEAQEELDRVTQERLDRERQLFKMKQTVFYEKKAFDKNNHEILKILDVDNNAALKDTETGRNSAQFARGSARTNNVEKEMLSPSSPNRSDSSFQSKKKRQRFKRTITSEKTLEEIEKEVDK